MTLDQCMNCRRRFRADEQMGERPKCGLAFDRRWEVFTAGRIRMWMGLLLPPMVLGFDALYWLGAQLTTGGGEETSALAQASRLLSRFAAGAGALSFGVWLFMFVGGARLSDPLAMLSAQPGGLHWRPLGGKFREFAWTDMERVEGGGSQRSLRVFLKGRSFPENIGAFNTAAERERCLTHVEARLAATRERNSGETASE